MYDLPKKMKGALEELAQEAYRNELRYALTELRAEFDRLDRGEISPFDLQESIRQFDRGRRRELYKKYTSPALDTAVAHAIHTRMLDSKSVDKDVLIYLSGHLEFYKMNDEVIEDENR